MAGRSTLEDLDPEARAAFIARLRRVIETVGTQPAAAEVARVSLAQLKNYLTGTSAPSFLPVARLAEAVGFDLHWLLTGEGPERRVGVSLGAAVRDGLRYGERTSLKVTTARAIGEALEQTYGVLELTGPVDDAVGDLAESIVELAGSDEKARRDLVEKVIALARATRGA